MLFPDFYMEGLSKFLDFGLHLNRFGGKMEKKRNPEAELQQLFCFRTANCLINYRSPIIFSTQKSFRYYNLHNCAQLANTKFEQGNILDLTFLHGHLLIDGTERCC